MLLLVLPGLVVGGGFPLVLLLLLFPGAVLEPPQPAAASSRSSVRRAACRMNASDKETIEFAIQIRRYLRSFPTDSSQRPAGFLSSSSISRGGTGRQNTNPCAKAQPMSRSNFAC